MILDTISDGKFVFKNTYADNKQIKMAVDAEEAPEEFFFLHIKLTPSFFLKMRFACSASCVSMLQTSCIVFIQQCHEQGLINDEEKRRFKQYIQYQKVQSEIQNQMKALVTRVLDDERNRQAVYLRAVVSRVRKLKFNLIIIL